MKSSFLRLGHIYMVSDGHERFECQYQCPETHSLEVSEHVMRRTDNGQLLRVKEGDIITEVKSET